MAAFPATTLPSLTPKEESHVLTTSSKDLENRDSIRKKNINICFGDTGAGNLSSIENGFHPENCEIYGDRNLSACALQRPPPLLHQSNLTSSLKSGKNYKTNDEESSRTFIAASSNEHADNTDLSSVLQPKEAEISYEGSNFPFRNNSLQYKNLHLDSNLSSSHQLAIEPIGRMINSAPNSGNTGSQHGTVLPPELRRILSEVARTGKSSSLPWSINDIIPNSFKQSGRNQKYSGIMSCHRRHREKSFLGQNRTKLAFKEDTISHYYDYSNRQDAGEKIEKNSDSTQCNDGSTKSDEKEKKLTQTQIEETKNLESKLNEEEKHRSHVHGSSDVELGILPRSEEMRHMTPQHSDDEKGIQNKVLNRKRSRNITSVPVNCNSSCSESISSVGGDSSVPSSTTSLNVPNSLPFQTLRAALGHAVRLVLDHSYINHGGYKLSPAEKRRHESQKNLRDKYRTGNMSTSGASDSTSCSTNVKNFPSSSSDFNEAEIAFLERRKRLVNMLANQWTPQNHNFETDKNPPISSIAASTSTPAPFVHSPGNVSDVTIENEESNHFGGGKGSQKFATSSLLTASANRLIETRYNDANSKLDGRKRRRRILGGNGDMSNYFAEDSIFSSGPPFTIQRVAEVLVSPDKYYSQTHKLCNALEKLLLVTCPSSAFGGVFGGETSQTRKEERERVALADERERQDTEKRQKLLRRRISSSSLDGGDPMLQMNVNVDTNQGKSSIDRIDSSVMNKNRREVIENASLDTAAGASTNPLDDNDRGYLTPNPLLSNDNIVIDILKTGAENEPIGGSAFDLDGISRSSLQGKFVSIVSNTMGSNFSNLSANDNRRNNATTSIHSSLERNDVSDIGNHDSPLSTVNLSDDFRHHLQDPHSTSPSSQALTHHPDVNRPLSPILFHTNPELNSLISDHHQSVRDIDATHASVLSQNASPESPDVQMEIVIDPNTSPHPNTSSGANGVPGHDVGDLYVDQGRSSASNSDIDSESGDDVSLDDSASDRSDGSDSGSGTGYFEFTAARVMALNRMQQQRQREQYLQNRALAQLAASGSIYQPPSDSEYQSGDSIDSTMAEDSCGSDSSSSDVAD